MFFEYLSLMTCWSSHKGPHSSPNSIKKVIHGVFRLSTAVTSQVPSQSSARNAQVRNPLGRVSSLTP